MLNLPKVNHKTINFLKKWSGYDKFIGCKSGMTEWHLENFISKRHVSLCGWSNYMSSKQWYFLPFTISETRIFQGFKCTIKPHQNLRFYVCTEEFA